MLTSAALTRNPHIADVHGVMDGEMLEDLKEARQRCRRSV
jgi:hypothetical protein